MRAGARNSIAVAVLTLTPLALLAALTPRDWTTPTGEVDRIRTHLATVEAELLAADVSRLTSAQRAARSRHIAVLREYRRAGVFPHNHTVAERRVPVFVDEHGTHCAVGYLLARDGRHDVIERVRTRRNHAIVPELADEPELVAWLAEAGLTLQEAARIQPAYDPRRDPRRPSDPPVERNSAAYKNATVMVAGLGGGMSAWNLSVAGDAARRGLPGALGFGVGVAEIALGVVGLVDRAAASENTRGVAEPAYIAVNFGVGMATAALGLRNLLRSEPAAPRATESAPQRVQWQLSPWSPSLDGGAGMRLDVRF